MPLRELEAEIAASRITVEKLRVREKISIVEMARYVTNEEDAEKGC